MYIVCMHIYIYSIYMCVHIYISKYIHIYLSIHLSIYVYLFVGWPLAEAQLRQPGPQRSETTPSSRAGSWTRLGAEETAGRLRATVNIMDRRDIYRILYKDYIGFYRRTA